MGKQTTDFRYNTGATKVPWAAVGENYNAQDLMEVIRFLMKGEGEEYENAIAAFENMGGYKDSARKIELCWDGIRERLYREAIVLMESGKYTEAIAVFEELDGYNLRFGLTYVDHETGQRRWKKSRYYYAEICKTKMVN